MPVGDACIRAWLRPIAGLLNAVVILLLTPASRDVVDSTPPLSVSLLAGIAKRPPLVPLTMTTATEPLPVVRICCTVPTAVPFDINVMPVVRPANRPLVIEVVALVPGNIRF